MVQLSYMNKKYKNDCCCVGFLSAAEDSSSEQFSGGVGWGGVVAEQEQLDMKGGVSVELYWHLTSFFMHHEININSINQSV